MRMHHRSLLASSLGILMVLTSQLTQASSDSGNFLLIPDIHLNSTTTHKMVIDPSDQDDANDLDSATFQDELSILQESINEQKIATPEFIIFLGDMVQHRRHGPSEAVADERAVFTALRDFDKPLTHKIPIFFVFGNHDSLPAVWGEFYSAQAYEGFHSPYEIAMDSGWHDGFLTTGKVCDPSGSFTEPCISTENTQFGYYTAYLRQNLKMLALNTVMFTPQRVGTTEQDALDELTWLESELRTAARQHESVLITTHVPFGNTLDGSGSGFWVATDQTKFLQLLATYKDNIIGVLAAHTHREEAKIIKEDLTKKNIAVIIYGAALSTYSGNAPSCKTMYFANNGSLLHNRWLLTNYETLTFTPGNFEQYFAKLDLQKLYKYSDYYCSPQDQSILACAKNISAKKMEHYYTAGNPNYSDKIKHPENIFVTIPNTLPPAPIVTTTSSSGSSSSGGAIAAIAATAGVVVAGITLFESSSE